MNRKNDSVLRVKHRFGFQSGMQVNIALPKTTFASDITFTSTVVSLRPLLMTQASA